jgi:5'(3')-deoxyribonucleotidase
MAIIGCDMDSILAALLPVWLQWHNERWQPPVTVDMVTEWDMTRVVSPDCGRQILTLLDDVRLYERVPPLAGAVAGITRLFDAGHDLVVVTDASGHEDTCGDKIRWLRRHLPWLVRTSIGIFHRKELICFDALIEDNPKMLLKYRRRWPTAVTVCIDYPYNREVPVDYRARDYRDPAAAWTGIADFLLQRLPLVKS